MPEVSPAPPGAFVEIDSALIDEGKFIETLTAKLRHGYRELLAYEKESSDMTAKVVTTVKITICRMAGSSTAFDVNYNIANTIPSVTRSSFVKEAGGRLLCQPAGSNADNPDQQLYFDARGRIIGGVDPETGEMHDEPVAGRIGKTKQA